MSATKLGFILLAMTAAAIPLAGQESKEFRGRLPAHYSGIVTEGQRREIYKIQERFAAKISDLQAQLDVLKKERDDAVEGVLTAAQLKRLAKAREEGPGKRKKAIEADAEAK